MTKSDVCQFLTRGTKNAHCATCAFIPYAGFSQIQSHIWQMLDTVMCLLQFTQFHCSCIRQLHQASEDIDGVWMGYLTCIVGKIEGIGKFLRTSLKVPHRLPLWDFCVAYAWCRTLLNTNITFIQILASQAERDRFSLTGL